MSGATIDGDGSVVCLIDLREISVRAGGTGHVGGSIHHGVSSAAEPSVALSGRKARVLVVEDSVGVRELERVILESAGYDVVTAVDGLDGIARLRAQPADLVLSDVEMPGMDGFTLTRTIRRTRGWEQVPVVIMTSRGDEVTAGPGLRPARAPTCSRASSIRPSWLIRFAASSADREFDARILEESRADRGHR